MKWYYILAIIIVVLIIFFFPKSSNDYGGAGLLPPNAEYSYVNKVCSCVGFNYDSTPNLVDAGHRYKCAGIPLNCECTQYNIKSGEVASTQIIEC